MMYDKVMIAGSRSGPRDSRFSLPFLPASRKSPVRKKHQPARQASNHSNEPTANQTTTDAATSTDPDID